MKQVSEDREKRKNNVACFKKTVKKQNKRMERLTIKLTPKWVIRKCNPCK